MIVDVYNEENITLTPPGAETLTFPQNKINTMAADALATQGARSSTALVLTMQDESNLDFHMTGFNYLRHFIFDTVKMHHIFV